MGEWSRIVNYRQIQLDKLSNVEVNLNSPLSAEDVLEYGAEIVIVATGCHFATDGLNAATHEPIEGADTSLDWQLTPDEVVARDASRSASACWCSRTRPTSWAPRSRRSWPARATRSRS